MDAGVDGGSHEGVARIGDRRHAGVGEQQDRAAVGQRREQPREAGALHGLVEGHHPSADGDAEVGGQPVQTAGVLDGEDVGARQDLAQPRADVAGVPEGRAAEHQPSAHASEPVTGE